MSAWRERERERYRKESRLTRESNACDAGWSRKVFFMTGLSMHLISFFSFSYTSCILVSFPFLDTRPAGSSVLTPFTNLAYPFGSSLQPINQKDFMSRQYKHGIPICLVLAHSFWNYSFRCVRTFLGGISIGFQPSISREHIPVFQWGIINVHYYFLPLH